MLQRKEQDKTSEELSEMETGNLPDKVFKEMIIKMFKELRRRWYNTVRSQKFLTDLENIKNQKEMKNIITVMKKYTRRNQKQIR